MPEETHPESTVAGSSSTPVASEQATGYECPLRRVLAVNDQGIVVESVRGFEIGSTMVLGCHVEAAHGAGVFVSAETMVVQSEQPLRRRLRHDATIDLAVDSAVKVEGDERFQVTLLFSDISGEDRELLVNLSSVEGIRLASGPTARVSGLAIPPPQVFSVTDSTVKKLRPLTDDVDSTPGADCPMN